MRTVIFCSLVALVSACGGGNLEDIEPKLSSLQAELFTPQCATSGCHSSSDKAGDLDLSAAAKVISATNQESEEGDGYLVIEPGNANNSSLYLRLVNTELGARMPQGKSALPQGAMDAVADWINAGAKND